MYSEDELISISLLQHFVFCPRRAALIGIEQHWEENAATVEGAIMHERAHSDIAENRGDLRVRNALHLRSLELGIIGIADVVEFHKTTERGITLPNVDGKWLPVPVEYKRGTAHEELPYQIQLCAQTLCLEEMLHFTIEKGAIYWGESRRRQFVEFDFDLRKKSVEAINALREFLSAGKTPAPRYDKKCKGCSLFDICMPKEVEKRSVSRYLMNFFDERKERTIS